MLELKVAQFSPKLTKKGIKAVLMFKEIFLK